MKLLGSGSYAKVFLHVEDDIEYAIKKYFKGKNWTKSAFREIETLEKYINKEQTTP